MTRKIRKRLDHTAHFAGRFGAIYFVTICCQRRGSNQLCQDKTAAVLENTARIYHRTARWNLNLLLLMPDHLHALIGIALPSVKICPLWRALATASRL
jgi:REP element-mobilizing transposase RayT